MIKEHAAAIFALIDAQPSLTIHAGHVPESPTFPYAVLYTDAGLRSPLSLTLASDELRMAIQVTSVGLTAESVQIVQEKVVAALLDVRPTVAGRSCFPIRPVNTRPAVEDRDVILTGGAHPLYAVDEYQLTSIPA